MGDPFIQLTQQANVGYRSVLGHNTASELTDGWLTDTTLTIKE
jgi:hypothetical protein